MIKMKPGSIIIFLNFIFIFFSKVESNNSVSFIRRQNGFERVIAARSEKTEDIEKKFSDKKIGYPPSRIFLRCFKNEKEIELWSESPDSGKFVLIKKFKMTGSSGVLGPKRKSGDLQVPEGFYFIERFNPVSNFYLSLGINYPNQSDKILGNKENPGCDIFIHGGDATIGCIPIGDKNIKELYLIALDVKSNGQKNIPVHIFPCKMTDENVNNILKPLCGTNKSLKIFWNNLKEGYDIFEKIKRIFDYSINKTGGYVFRAE
ncbi:MAG TPA: hypothetical protein PKY81_08195 [bacterium]|nr:hypothetical protein [bacterium]HPN30924.1 hypothetical protein [bacterium]